MMSDMNHVEITELPARDMHTRFERMSTAVVDALGALGVPSAIGEIPDEYCAGEWSVHVRGSRKVMGVGQRLTRAAAQVGGMIVLSDPESINRVLETIYAALGVALDPAATGAVSDVAEVSAHDVIHALATERAGYRPIERTTLAEPTAALGRRLRPAPDPARASGRR